MEQTKLLEAHRLFDAPVEFMDLTTQMVRDVEWEVILLMGRENVPDARLRQEIWDNRLASDPADLIRECYHRCIIDKVVGAEEPAWHIANFYRRVAFVGKYEFYLYTHLPLERIRALNEQWRFPDYLAKNRSKVESEMRGEPTTFHNRHFCTLEEADALIDKHAHEITLHACNCKSQFYWRHEKPLTTCLDFGAPVNSAVDRGHGDPISAEDAKKLIRRLNACGLMQNGDESGVCNCDGKACHPMQIAQAVGSRGMYPTSDYVIEWHPEQCISCGRCRTICNFGAFYKGTDGKTARDENRCWGCTICAPNCPKGAIHLIPKKK